MRETIFVDECEEGLLLYRGMGDFFANDMIAGSAMVGGTAGKLWGYGMRRGTIIFAKRQLVSPHVFKETNHDFSSYWGLLKPVIESFNGPFANLANVTPKRFVGDLPLAEKENVYFLEI